MKAIIVTSFDTYLERVELLKDYYESMGYEVNVVLSNFRHLKKEFIDEKSSGYIYVNTKPYYKNLSVQRLRSHYLFSKDAFDIVKKLNPDLLHVLIPANSLAKEAKKYKRDNPKTRLILDLIDLWPETMPIGSIKNHFPFSLWKNVRDKNLNNADIIYNECNLYKEILNKEDDLRFKTLYWAKKTKQLSSNPSLSDDKIHLCYLGSINNIISIDDIVLICKKINDYKPVTLEIIGGGENKDKLIKSLENNSIKVVEHGLVYNQIEKQKIFDCCHFGLNIYKKSVCIGLTMKSLDYFQAGLPVINNIRGDTWELINKNNAGINFDNDLNINQLSLDSNLQMRKNSLRLYENNFSKRSFFSTMEK